MNIRIPPLAGPLAAAMLLATTSLAGSPKDGDPITCGTFRRIRSVALNEERTLLVRLPPDYATSRARYPVLVKLDGYPDVFMHTVGAVQYVAGWTEGAPDYIVVAVENTDRNRDMCPDRGAPAFIRFLAQELVPFIEAEYRTNGFRLLCGQSLSSVLALQTFVRAPDSFDGFVLSSFGLSPEWLKLFQDDLAKSAPRRDKVTFIYVANARHDAYDPDGSRTENGRRFLDALRGRAPQGLRIESTTYPDEGHVPYPTLRDALVWIDARQRAVRK